MSMISTVNRNVSPQVQLTMAQIQSIIQMEPDLMEQSTSYFKKDLLWKPLIRRFRRYIKKEALPTETYAKIFSKPVTKWASHFCKAFQVPDELASDTRVQNAILLLVASHRITRRKTLIFECKLLMAQHIDDLWPRYFQVFNDSNQRYRLSFYTEPLVQFLWGKFIVEKPHIVAEYVEMAGRNSTSDAMAVHQRSLFMKDIQKIEKLTGCQIFPC